MAAFPAGIAIDRYGVKTGVVLWLGLTGIPLFFLSFIHYYYLFLVVAALSGLGYGIGNPVASKGLFIWFDQRTRGTAFGIRQAAVTVGGAAAGIFLVYLCERMGPFSAIRIISLMIIAVMGFAIFLYRNPATDGSGSGKGSKRIEFGVLFKNTPLLLLSLYMAMLGLAQGVVITFLILYINETLGYSLIMSGSFLTMLMIGAAAGRIFWGLLSDRMFQGRRKPALLMISALAFASVAVLACWSKGNPDWLLMIVVIVIGMSSVGWNSIGLVTVSEISGKAIANLDYEKVTHNNPVFIGDTIRAETEILEVRESKTKPDRGIVFVETRAFNQNNEKVLTFRRHVLVPKKDS